MGIRFRNGGDNGLIGEVLGIGNGMLEWWIDYTEKTAFSNFLSITLPPAIAVKSLGESRSRKSGPRDLSTKLAHSAIILSRDAGRILSTDSASSEELSSLSELMSICFGERKPYK